MVRNEEDSLVLSKHSYNGVNYEGTLYVGDTVDDDWVGIIFSYQSLNRFYALISAKQSPGNHKTLVKGGWRLVRVGSTTGGDTSHLAAAIVSTQSVRNQTTILWSDPARQVRTTLNSSQKML